MTKKNIKKDDKNVSKNDKKNEVEENIENKLKEEIEDEIEKSKKIYEELSRENEKLKEQIQEQEQTLKNVQLQYLSLKNEFDSFTNRVKKNEKKQKEDIFEKTILKMIPIIELFLSSYEHLPEELKDNKWSEWLDIIYKKINSFLLDSNIEIIKTIWEEPDETKHEILGMEAVEDKKKKNKIIKEIKKWYILKNSDKEKVLIPAKVVVWI